MRSYSYGGGWQSTAMLVLVAQGELEPGPFLFANVGDDSEHPDTLEFVRNAAMPYAEAHGVEVVELQRTKRDGTTETLRQRIRQGSMAIPVRRTAGGPPMSRSCTADFKTRVIGKELKRRGASRGNPWTVCIGISVDEIERAKPGPDPLMPWQVRHYPLLELGLHRRDCAEIIGNAALPIPPKSSCFFCPFHDVNAWRDLLRNRPDLFAEAVQMEAEMSAATSDGRPVFLTRYGVPLDVAITDHPTLFPAGPEQCDSGFCWT